MFDTEAPTPNLIPVRLVPVEVFGADRCCTHYPNGVPADRRPDDCHAVGFGLMDAVSAWSDCNRADGHIFRFDDMPDREPGESLTVWVDASEYEAFAKRDWRENPDDLARQERP